MSAYSMSGSVPCIGNIVVNKYIDNYCKGRWDQIQSCSCGLLLHWTLSHIWPKRPVMAILGTSRHILSPVPSQKIIYYITVFFCWCKTFFFSFKLRSLLMILYNLNSFMLFHIKSVLFLSWVCLIALAQLQILFTGSISYILWWFSK